jgi:hypothetical protein
MKRLPFLLALLSLLAAGPALAAVPSVMSYQGVLMDDAGALVPDGDYSLTFQLYDAASGGTTLWTETQNPVPVSRGGFSVLLGSVVSLTGLAFDVPYWLGVTVGAGTELAPRTLLASSPYGLGLRLPFSGAVSSTAPALLVANTGSGPAIKADPSLTVGTTLHDGTVLVYGNGTIGAEIFDYPAYGGAFHLYDAGGNPTMALEPDYNGDAGWFYVYGGAGSFMVDGNAGGTGSPTVTISGSGGSSTFQTSETGNAAVQLPASSVAAAEMLDEPGIAQEHLSNSVVVPIGTTMGDIATVTIAIPVAGYIVLEAGATHSLYGSSSATYNYAYLQIDETAGGSIVAGQYVTSGFNYNVAGLHNGYTYTPVSLRRVYAKTAGLYTFRLEARGAQSEYLTNTLFSPIITATFYPTSYGSVTTAVTAEEASRFSDVQRVASPDPLEPQGAGEAIVVDLRELELRAAQERTEAERAERRLLEARIAEQMAKPAKSTSTKP